MGNAFGPESESQARSVFGARSVGPVLFVNVGELGEGIAVPFVESVGVQASAAGGHAQGGETMLPCPVFGLLAEAKADLAIAMTIFHHETADEGMGRGLKVMLDRYFDPANNIICDAGDEGSLVSGAMGKGVDPCPDFGGGALVAELFGQRGDLVRILRLDGPDEKLRSSWIVHDDDLLMQTSWCKLARPK
jgi:hypothetical protein